MKNAVVVGAGIVGLSVARALSLKGYSVTIVERSEQAVGASIRNFGMIWPIGQPSGELLDRANRTKTIWKGIADSTGLWYNESGSLHAAYQEDEWIVLQELYEIFKAEGRFVELLNKSQIIDRFNAVNSHELIGGLFSSAEMIIDPRVGIKTVAIYLTEFLNVQFKWGQAVVGVETGKVFVGNEEIHTDLVFICSGADFETLYPVLFASKSITKCKLQMMRFKSANDHFNIGTSLCGGLSLIHYNSFKAAPSLEALKKCYEAELPSYIKHGIHVMVSQNHLGELTVGDSHEYGLTFDPFDSTYINELIVAYLNQFINTGDWKLIQSWNGIYPKMTNGDNKLIENPEKDVYIVNGVGGAGMTLSFGLGEEVINELKL
jgi:FAD dependent oxidoreductase TIGR03364